MLSLRRHSHALRWFAALLLTAASSVNAASSGAPTVFAPVPETLYAGAPFDLPRVTLPQIPARAVSIVDFGAVGDGRTLNTDAFARAIGQLADQGGGRVVVPRGIWLTGPIVLRDRIELHTEAGAVVLFSPDRTLYPLVETNFEGGRSMRCQSPLSANGAQHIAITGAGVFDGSGQAWRPVKRAKLTEAQWRDLVASGGVLDDSGQIWWPSAGALAGARGDGRFRDGRPTREDFERIRDFLRPVMVSLRECRQVLIDGPTFQNSPAWNLHPLLCEEVVIRHVTVLNPWYSQNGDGLDLDSCRNGVVYGCTFDVGDDAICLKSGKDAEGRARGRPTENFVIRDNVVYHGHGGFIVGSEMSGGVRNIFAADLTFIGTDVGIRFKSTRGRGGGVENIHIDGVNMLNISTEPIHFNLFYSGSAPAEDDAATADPADYLSRFPAVSETTPSFRHITIRNVICRGAGTAMWIRGLPEMPVQDVRLENVQITAMRGARLIDVAGIQFDRVQIEATEGPLLQLQNAQSFIARDTALARTAGSSGPLDVRVAGPLTRDVDLRGMTSPTGPLEFLVLSTLPPGRVQLPNR